VKLSKCASLLLTLAGITAPAVASPGPVITIRVLDQAKLPQKKIQKIERYVAASLAFIQVDVNWVDCRTNLVACEAVRGPNEFWLRILAQMPPAVYGGVETLGLIQYGDKPGDRIQCVNIFYPMVRDVAERARIGVHVVFGAAVVHEIGHLYLGKNGPAHSRTGVMCGTWSRREFDLADIGKLNFTSDQGDRIRHAMSSASGL
jgi:hypothetical protein